MATYYASQFIPTSDSTHVFAFTLIHNTGSYSPANGTIANFATQVTSIEGQFNGDLTWTYSTVSGGKMFELIYTDPDEALVSLNLTDQTSANKYNMAWSRVMTCAGCGDVEWAECEDEYVINLGLTASTSYDYILTHGQTGIEYTQTSTTNGSGVTTWDASVSPELYVNGNVFTLTATTSGEDVMFIYKGTEYSCMVIEIVKQTDLTPAP